MNTWKAWTAAAGLVALSGAAQAAPVFQGRLADGTASTTCTVSGPNKCAMYYDTTLDITILNNWNIGRGLWSATAAAGSAQALVEAAGAAQTDFSGWLLPTGDGSAAGGALNQYRSIWNDAGGSLSSLQAQFDGVLSADYWSRTADAATSTLAWEFVAYVGVNTRFDQDYPLLAVAVRPGDVAISMPVTVPEPQTLALALLALGVTAAARRRRAA